MVLTVVVVLVLLGIITTEIISSTDGLQMVIKPLQLAADALQRGPQHCCCGGS
jgi:hypothetical protein